MDNVFSFSEFSRGTKRPREDDDEISMPLAREYGSKIRKKYPFRSTAEIYKAQGISDVFHTRQEDPDTHLIPEDFILPQHIDYTLLSADIICKYYSMKRSMTISMGVAYNAVRDYVNSTEAMADIAGTVAGVAAASVFTGAVIATAPYIAKHTPLSLLRIAITTVRWLASPLLSGAFTTGISTYGSRKVHNYIRDSLKRKRLKEGIAKHISDAEAFQREEDAALFRLKGNCVNIYSKLCESRGLGVCNHKEPYNCRKMYLQSFPDSGTAMLTYMQIPNDIM